MRKDTGRRPGMGQSVSRRDILHGFGAVAATSFVPGEAFAQAVLAAEEAGRPYYPPALAGMRGNHDGSFEVAHALAREGRTDWGPVSEPDRGVYDLVVVGAGISGLAAAHFYLKDHPDARILIIDNHDDFGGHAKRNEYTINGGVHLGYGGSQSLVSPNHYPRHTKTLVEDLGIDVNKLGDAYDQGFFKRHDLAAGIHFDKKDWGVDRVVRHNLGGMTYLPLADPGLSAEEVVAEMPLSDAAKSEFLKLLTASEDVLGTSYAEQEEYLYSISYREYLERHLDIHEPEVFAVLQDLTLDYGAGIEAVSARDGFGYSALPGRATTKMDLFPDDELYIHHFPDGNATVARMLVRRMIPGVAPGSTDEDILMAPFDYAKLDLEASAVRLRLNSTVVRVMHDGNPDSAQQVGVDYVQDGQAARVRGKHVILACYNAAIPYLCPELPAEQREALAIGVKMPILYTNVLFRNWHSFKNLGIGAAVSSGSYHPMVKLDFPVSYGGQQFAQSPDDPIILTMEKFVHRNNAGLSPREQRRVGRYELLATSFETIEQSIRAQLTSLLGAGGFDADRDIAGITVNRWAHGYSDGFYDLGDEWSAGEQPNVVGRKPFGRITIANSDAGGSAMLEGAVGQAWRAVRELT